MGPDGTPMRGPGAAWIVVVGLGGGAALAGCLGGSPHGLILADSFEVATGVVLFNGAVWTADDARPWATGVAYVGDRLVAVGSDADVMAADVGPRPLRVDLAGRMVLPGFHDTHNHFAEVARAYDASAGGNPYEPWPPGWDPVEGSLAQQQVALGHVQVWGEHNVQRLLSGNFPAPPARLHGMGHDLEERDARHRANDLFAGGPERANAPEAWKAILRLGLEIGARFGITSHVEAGTGLDTFDVLEALDAEGALTARFNLYVFPEDLQTVLEHGWTTGTGDDDVRLLGLKIYADGWLGPRTAALRDLYNDRPHQGFIFYTQDEVDAWVERAHRAGLKVTAHTIGDRATDMMLTAYERALAAGCPTGATYVVCASPRFSLEHVQLVPPDLVDRMAAIGLVPSIQLSFATSDAPWAESALGPDRLAHAYPWRTFIERGLTVGGSSDFPIEVLPPLWGVQRAVTRIDLNGEPAGGFQPAQALDLDTALRTITIGAAYLEYREHELGSLEEGKLADLVVLERDIFSIPGDQIAATKVQLTVVGGRTVYQGDAWMPTA